MNTTSSKNAIKTKPFQPILLLGLSIILMIGSSSCKTTKSSCTHQVTQVSLMGGDTVKVNCPFEVSMNAVFSSGRRWHYMPSDLANGVTLKDEIHTDTPEDPKYTHQQTFRFTATELGNDTLRFVNKRSWENNPNDVTQFIHIVIQ